MNIGPTRAALPLWLVAEAGFVAAGLGLAGVRGLRSVWQPIAFFAGVSSVALLAHFIMERRMLLGLRDRAERRIGV